MLNGAFDAVSLSISRYFGQWIATAKSLTIPMWCGLGLLDVLVSLVCMAALGVLLVLSLSIIGTLILPDAGIGMESYIGDQLARIRVNPLGEDVMWITLMLWSTMLPTIVHLMVIFFSAIWTVGPNWVVGVVFSHLAEALDPRLLTLLIGGIELIVDMIAISFSLIFIYFCLVGLPVIGLEATNALLDVLGAVFARMPKHGF